MAVYAVLARGRGGSVPHNSPGGSAPKQLAITVAAENGNLRPR